MCILIGMKQQRDPDHTRHTILEAAAQEIHLHGFQAASLSRILATTGLTKGALYHHFPNKQALGYAVLEEVIAVEGRKTWVSPLEQCDDPVDCLQGMIASRFKDMTEQDLLLGCPLNNLALEMSPIDEGFRRRVEFVYDRWTQALAAILAAGRAVAVSGALSTRSRWRPLLSRPSPGSVAWPKPVRTMRCWRPVPRRSSIIWKRCVANNHFFWSQKYRPVWI